MEEYIILRKKYKFNIQSKLIEYGFLDGKYCDIYYLTGNCPELDLFNRTICIQKSNSAIKSCEWKSYRIYN